MSSKVTFHRRSISSAELHHGENQNKGNPNRCHHPLITQLSWEVTILIYISAVIQMVHHYSMFFLNLLELSNQIRTSILWVLVGKILQVNNLQKVSLPFLKRIWTKILHQKISQFSKFVFLKSKFNQENINVLFLKTI